LIEQYRGNQGLLIIISIVFIAGILSLLKWKFRKTATFYVQIFFIVVLSAVTVDVGYIASGNDGACHQQSPTLPLTDKTAH